MAIDFLIPEDGTQFQLTRSDEYHGRDIVRGKKGDFKINPQLGVDITSYLQDTGNQNELRANIIIEFERDTVASSTRIPPEVIFEANGEIIFSLRY